MNAVKFIMKNCLWYKMWTKKKKSNENFLCIVNYFLYFSALLSLMVDGAAVLLMLLWSITDLIKYHASMNFVADIMKKKERFFFFGAFDIQPLIYRYDSLRCIMSKKKKKKFRMLFLCFNNFHSHSRKDCFFFFGDVTMCVCVHLKSKQLKGFFSILYSVAAGTISMAVKLWKWERYNEWMSVG